MQLGQERDKDQSRKARHPQEQPLPVKFGFEEGPKSRAKGDASCHRSEQPAQSTPPFA